jgi:FkbM family methyltransferase
MWIARKLMQTESEWNPKVMMGRVATRVLPESVLHILQKNYYAYVLKHKLGAAEHDQTLVGLLVSEGDWVVDVGASIGGYTKFLSEKVGPRGRVYSFEPNPPTFDFLTHNIAALKLSNVEAFNVAVSDTMGSAQLKIPLYRWGSECHYDARLDGPIRPEWRSVTVKKGTLDSFLANQEISFIKCDANFHELACLRGAQKLIEKCMPAMLIEVNPNPDDPATSAHQTFSLLGAAGYEAYWLDGEKLRRRLRGERSQNYFFLTPRHLDLLTRRGVLLTQAQDTNSDAGLSAIALTAGQESRN